MTRKSRSVQESKPTTSHIPITQCENYAGGKLYNSSFLLSSKWYRNGIQTELFTKKLSPIQSTTSVLLLPTRALFIFWEAGSEFSHSSYAHERFVFRCCFFRCCSTMALPKPQTDQFSWSVVQLMSWDINFLGTVQMQFAFYHDDTDPTAEQLLNNQSLRSEERPTSPC